VLTDVQVRKSMARIKFVLNERRLALLDARRQVQAEEESEAPLEEDAPDAPLFEDSPSAESAKAGASRSDAEQKA